MPQKSILRALRTFDGYPDLTAWQLKDIRYRNNLPLRRKTISDTEKQQAIEIIEEALQSGISTQWGIGYTQTYIRQNHDLFVSREQVWHILRHLNPNALADRRLDTPRMRQRFIVAGPMRVVSCDGHDKLSGFGFQIYGFIDAYSRRILGMFVDLSNRTAIAVQKFYLKIVEQYGIPQLLRCDKGTETLLMTACQYSLRLDLNPQIGPRDAVALVLRPRINESSDGERP